MGIVVNTHPEMIFPVCGCQEHHTISLLFDDADLVVAHEICETILCFRRDWFDFNGVHCLCGLDEIIIVCLGDLVET